MKTLAVAVVIAAVAATPAAAAPKPPVPCGVNLVSFYFGGFSQNLSLATFDITLLAHDGVTCTLTDTPLLTVSGPSSPTVPIHAGGRGGTFTLRPDNPVHARVAYNTPDLPENAVTVSSMRLAMPDGSFRGTFFGVPGAFDIDKDGVTITAWQTGIGLGDGEGTS